MKKILSLFFLLNFFVASLNAQVMSKAEECEVLYQDLIDAYDDSINPLFLKVRKEKNQFTKLESVLTAALNSKDKNSRRVLISVTSGVVSVALGYFAFKNISSAIPKNALDILIPSGLELHWRIIMGLGAVSGTTYSIIQVRDIFLSKKQLKEALIALKAAKEALEKTEQKLDEKMCEANKEIQKELESNSCASIEVDYFECPVVIN